MSLSEPELISLRRELHQIPEIGMEEYETQALLLQTIKKMPQTWLEIKTWKTAILVHVIGQNHNYTIGYRTDIDALPVTEATGLPYTSKHPGKMHACGHDIHMTVAIGVLSYFAEHQPTTNLTFIFQPAEENASGGKQLYDAGILDQWMPDEIYGLHDNPQLPAGVIGCCQGTLFAGTCEIHAHFIGKSGHAAFPQDANDMVVAGATFVTQIQTIVSRNIDPIQSGVVTLGHFSAGTIGNVIAGSAQIDGTIRALTQKNNLKIQQRVRKIAEAIAAGFECQLELDLHQGGYYPVENNPETTSAFIKYMKNTPGITFQETNPAMTGEDFGYLLAKIPGTMFWLGVDSPYSLHSEHMAPKEEAIQKGVAAITGFILQRQTEIN
ncbi:MAG: N-acetyldiaminopimelate deacetylase [Liquorilactobacillus nagelii]|jgi:N-acetyldiaminopimelate deacetylase|uniref:N-acetyldiaminopimelate deacetylase n=1 Tax=Liquorilactobacillus nagelii TaxID=82688 RepID=A0A3Q8CCP0_9LACO|nr:N-acetyldiaminopimelate deacetylase [Liquorilactobacillus nagelii]AUJ32568.1 N-acetyldiaminopimelate deacetylase [Liquorilactobacillus nagelii]KRL42481.1 M20 M25 M40 family peptidase [Liquorilactobacillus nagelii DSM 13675]MCC7616719.1 amidohydrolase [Liquorilactobacillus nagelii]MCI1634250.1 N-acetyldiaminopimelate deacetylase [Liquorilactobacillus nagelii]MCI1699852.1 N-acetyldiaminopimelate deacetylase [Liquorilactobacillus nagelii]